MLILTQIAETASHWHPDFVHQHPYAVIGGAIVAIQFANRLPAPTKDDAKWYVIFFALATAVGNLARSLNTKIETSPNWQDAAARHVETVKQNQVDLGS